MNDYRILGVTPTAVVSSGTFEADAGGFIVVKAFATVAITNLVLAFPRGTPLTSVSLPSGHELLQVKSLTVSGACQLFFFR